MTTDLEQIISGIKTSYNRSNLRDVDMEALASKRTPEQKLGCLLQAAPEESNNQYRINFDPMQNTFLNKLVSGSVIGKKINIDAKDFFKGVIFLDYLTNVIFGDYAVIDEVYQLAKELEKVDKNLDPTLKLIVKYSGMHYFQQFRKEIILKDLINVEDKNKGDIGRRYRAGHRRTNYQKDASENRSEYGAYSATLCQVSPIYESIGSKIYSFLTNDTVKEKICEAKSTYEVKAAVFVDSILEVLTDTEMRTEVEATIKKGDYYKSSMLAIASLSKEVNTAAFDNYVGGMIKKKTRNS